MESADNNFTVKIYVENRDTYSYKHISKKSKEDLLDDINTIFNGVPCSMKLGDFVFNKSRVLYITVVQNHE